MTDVAQVPLRELQEELSELRKLSESRGFKKLMLIAKEQAESRKNQIILSPISKLDDTWGQEYAKGEVAGIELIMEMTNVQIGVLESDIAELIKEENGNVEKA